MRGKDFEERLKQAKQSPQLDTALLRLGMPLKRVGYGNKYGCTEYKLCEKKGVAGDFSALVFCHNMDGTWRVLDNKQRYGRLAYDSIGFLTDFLGHSFDEAVYALSGDCANVGTFEKTPPEQTPAEAPTPLEFTPPPKVGKKFKETFAYLKSRNLDTDLVKSLVAMGLIYQSTVEITKGKSAGKHIPVIVFAVLNGDGDMVGADSCGTYTVNGFRFKHIFAGSDPAWAWRFTVGVDRITDDTFVFFCESAIDAISLYQLTKLEGVYVSMCGCKDITFESMVKIGGKAIICVDNDEAGDKFYSRHNTYPRLTPQGKDWNEDLQNLKGADTL